MSSVWRISTLKKKYVPREICLLKQLFVGSKWFLILRCSRSNSFWIRLIDYDSYWCLRIRLRFRYFPHWPNASMITNGGNGNGTTGIYWWSSCSKTSIKISWFQTWWRRLDIRFFTKLIQLVVFSQTFHWPKSYVSRGVIRETLRRGPYAVVKRARVGYTTAPFFTPFLDHSSTALWDSRMGDYWFLPE